MEMIYGKCLMCDGTSIVISKGDVCNSLSIMSRKTDRSRRIENWKYRLASRCSFTRRLMRAETTGLYFLKDGSEVVIAKDGLFRRQNGERNYSKCFEIPRGSKPLNFCFAPLGNIYFGEYFQNMGKQEVNIYSSGDNGQSWHIAYTFEAGNINHIHGLFFDKYTNRIWVATGDREYECIIGYTEDEFKTFVEVFRGGQEYRTCQLFFYKDFIVYGTDTQYQQNVIKKFDRKTLEITELQEVQGSVIKGGQVGDVAFISTTVEPSKVNTDKYAHLWVTKDGLHWEERYKAKKDWLPSMLFQFGTFEFPQYYGIDKLERLYFSGRALKGLDSKTTYIDL